jgi:hypothetical protein
MKRPKATGDNHTGIAAGDIEMENVFSFTMSADGTAP